MGMVSCITFQSLFSGVCRLSFARRKSSGASMKELLARQESKSTEEEMGKEREPPKLERTDLPPSRDTPSAVTPPNPNPFPSKKDATDLTDKP
uniref:Secreted protein n=1 Tax=Bursaphelenchus xylophilus TaxID=6326 RepID=A0A1I7SMM6_BURXY